VYHTSKFIEGPWKAMYSKPMTDNSMLCWWWWT